MAESPVLTPMEENIDITLYGDVEEKEETIRARVDTGLAISIISKTLTEKLQVKLKPSGQGPVTDSRGVTFSAVGETSLNWHRKDVPKTNEQTFFVVDLPGSFVIFGANALSLSKGFPIQTLGLKPQTDGMTMHIVYVHP